MAAALDADAAAQLRHLWAATTALAGPAPELAATLSYVGHAACAAIDRGPGAGLTPHRDAADDGGGRAQVGVSGSGGRQRRRYGGLPPVRFSLPPPAADRARAQRPVTAVCRGHQMTRGPDGRSVRPVARTSCPA